MIRGILQRVFGPDRPKGPPVTIHDRRRGASAGDPLGNVDCALIALSARYDVFPKDGEELARFAATITEVLGFDRCFLRVQNRLPGVPFELETPSGWLVLTDERDVKAYAFRAGALSGIARLFDRCGTRAYWQFTFVADDGDSPEVERRALTEFDMASFCRPERDRTAFLLVDTDDCNVIATFRNDASGSRELVDDGIAAYADSTND